MPIWALVYMYAKFGKILIRTVKVKPGTDIQMEAHMELISLSTVTTLD